MDDLILFVNMTLLIVLNGLFVAAEFAIVAAPRTVIEKEAAEGHRLARMVNEIIRDPRHQDRFIATAQLGITVASLGLGMYGEHMLALRIAHALEGWGAERWIAAHAIATVASVAAVAVLTYFHVVVGEMVPKSLALQAARRTAYIVVPVMRAIQFLVYPLVVFLNAIGNALLRTVGIDRRNPSAEHYRTPEELRYVVQESEAGGLLRKESAQVVHELLEFAELTASAVMVPRVRMVGIPIGASLETMRAILRTAPYTRYPVYDGTLDRVVGAMHVKDVLGRPATRKSLSAYEVRPVPFVPETSNMEHVLSVMRKERAQMAIVMDEHGGTAGLITIEDLFEEVVGDIGEDAAGRPEVFRDVFGRIHVAGTVRVEEVGAALGVILEHEDVDTVSGLVLAMLGRPPEINDVVTYDDVRFEVIAVEGRGVEECIVEVVVKPPEPAA